METIRPWLHDPFVLGCLTIIGIALAALIAIFVWHDRGE